MKTHLSQLSQSKHRPSGLRQTGVLLPTCASIRHALRVRHRIRRRTAQRKRTLCKQSPQSKVKNAPLSSANPSIARAACVKQGRVAAYLRIPARGARHRIRRRTAQRKPRAHSLKCENVPPGASPVLTAAAAACGMLLGMQPPTQAAPPSRSPTRRPETCASGNPLIYNRTVRQAIGGPDDSIP